MHFLTWAIWQIFHYGILTWVCFVAVALCATRFLGWRGILAELLCFAVILYFLDARQLAAWDTAPGFDGVTLSGTIARVVVLNVVLLPVSAFGTWLRHRSYHARNETNVA
jgi:hypothetical protein